jgi:hypothetical protein
MSRADRRRHWHAITIMPTARDERHWPSALRLPFGDSDHADHQPTSDSG